jgi:hypothetical protein
MTATAIVGSVPRSEHIPKLLRFPPSLVERIERLRKEGYRPFQSQVILMLEQWLEEHDAPAPKEGRRK